jgi:GNAT superfamily N-acetyltransferase
MYTTKEFSKKTWPDFEQLFLPPSGWNHCWCVHFHRPRPLSKSEWLPTRAQRAVRNRRMQRELIEKGCSHGILVYENDVPIGWCQYGRKEELPRIDNNRNYRRLALEDGGKTLWRITCFVVDKKYRRRGVGSLALRAALEAIKKKGGGLVEAYPVANWAGKSFGNMSTHGTVSMFQKAGFRRVGPYGNTNVVMRRSI